MITLAVEYAVLFAFFHSVFFAAWQQNKNDAEIVAQSMDNFFLLFFFYFKIVSIYSIF